MIASTATVLGAVLFIACVAALLYTGLPYLYGRLVRMILHRKAAKRGVLVLTFDDGPGSTLTPAILRVLAEYKVNASFFLLGRNLVGREEIVRQIVDEGHDLCSHGYSHMNYWRVSPSRSVADIVHGWRSIDSAMETGPHKYPFRPPYGRLNLFCLVYLLLRQVPILYWSIDSGDTFSPQKRDPARIAKIVDKKGGGIALLHDFDRADARTDMMVLESLRLALETAKHKGIRVHSMLEFLGIARARRDIPNVFGTA